MLGRSQEEDSLKKPASRVQGVGLGLRWELIDELLERTPSTIDFLEVSPENYMRRGGYYPSALEHARAAYPLVTHGLTMSVGGTDPLDDVYLRELAAFVRDVGSPWHSDHLCFGSSSSRVLHDLLPVAFKGRSVRPIADRIKRAQDVLGVPMAIENISFYMHPGKREMGEAEFIARVCDAADCGLLLDVNNAYVNAHNFGFDIDEWMRAAPLDRVVQMHVAGHEWFDLDQHSGIEDDRGDVAGAERIILDTHGADVCDPVLALLERMLVKTGPVPVLLERDQSFPSFDELLAEVAKIKAIWLRSAAATEKNAALSEVGEKARGIGEHRLV
jgi:uncharacterized protein (UPF0276 family)